MNNLKSLRLKYGIPTDVLANFLEVTEDEYLGYEQNTNKLTVGQVDLLSDLYACDFHYITGESDVEDGWKIPNIIGELLNGNTVHEIADIGRLVRNIREMQKLEKISSSFPF